MMIKPAHNDYNIIQGPYFYVKYSYIYSANIVVVSFLARCVVSTGYPMVPLAVDYQASHTYNPYC